jgi:DNA primase
VVNYGPENLPAGPDVEAASSIIIVEGRADVINLLKAGIKNVIAIEGANVPETVVKLSKDKEITAFLDGDHGGDIILKELLQAVNIDYVTRAPPGKEVEELATKELLRILRGRVPAEQLRREPPRVRRERRIRAPAEVAKEAPHVPEQITKTVEELKGTLEAVILDKDLNPTARLPVGELYEKLQGLEGVDTIVFDGVITQRLIDISSTKSVRNIIADRVSDITKRPVSIKLLTFADIIPRKAEKPKEAP